MPSMQIFIFTVLNCTHKEVNSMKIQLLSGTENKWKGMDLPTKSEIVNACENDSMKKVKLVGNVFRLTTLFIVFQNKDKIRNVLCW